jgi:hypothetical protein
MRFLFLWRRHDYFENLNGAGLRSCVRRKRIGEFTARLFG